MNNNLAAYTAHNAMRNNFKDVTFKKLCVTFKPFDDVLGFTEGLVKFLESLVGI